MEKDAIVTLIKIGTGLNLNRGCKMPVNYSTTEQALLALLKKKKRATAQELANAFYDKDNMPFYPDQTVRGLLARLQRKAEHNDEVFRIMTEKKEGENIVFIYSLKIRKIQKDYGSKTAKSRLRA
jgi:hypothetical protein